MTDEEAATYIAEAADPMDRRIRILEIGLLRQTALTERLVALVDRCLPQTPLSD